MDMASPVFRMAYVLESKSSMNHLSIYRRWVIGLNPYGLMLGAVLFAASLSPSLIPRGALVQGILGGVSAGIGYILCYWFKWLWTFFGGSPLPVKLNRSLIIVLGIVSGLILLFAFSHLSAWQNDIRSRMNMEPVHSARLPVVMSIAIFTFLALLLAGQGFAKFSKTLGVQLNRFLPKRAADSLGLILAILTVFIVTDKGVMRFLLQIADKTFEQAQRLVDPNTPVPSFSWQAGSVESLIDWNVMGAPGRKFVSEGPTADSISDFSKTPAMSPLRVYVGRAQAETPDDRARIALAELKRVGAFDRRVLIIASPTGTGWLDPAGHDPLEYLHNGNIATVAVQYSYLASPLSLLFETPNSAEQANATFDAVYTHWTTLPEDARPKLYVHGLSLGAYSSMTAYNVYRMIDDPIDGALWAGPPFPSQLSRQITQDRNTGSQYVLPTVGNGSLVRFANQNGFPEVLTDSEWGRMRLVFLQYASDPIVFFKSGSFFRKPEWMKEAHGPDVSPELKWTPIITTLQLGVDLALSKTPPDGFGHSYLAEDYIAPWIAVTNPDDWTDDKTARLKNWCGLEWGLGCKNEK